MNRYSTAGLRRLPVLSSLAFALALAGCGGSEAPPATQSMSRSAASVTLAAEQEQYAGAIQHLYVAYFGRPSEPMGMTYWNRQLQLAQSPTDPAGLLAHYRSNAQLRVILDAFANSVESQQLYPGTSAQFVNGVYRNLFNREAELAGLAWWVNAIDAGLVSRSDAALMIMLGARDDDALTVRNKIAVSHTFYRILNERTVYVLGYTGESRNEIVRRMMAQVNARTDLVAFEAVIRATIEQISGPVIN